MDGLREVEETLYPRKYQSTKPCAVNDSRCDEEYQWGGMSTKSKMEKKKRKIAGLEVCVTEGPVAR